MIFTYGNATKLIVGLTLAVAFMPNANAQFVVLTDPIEFSGNEELIDFAGAGTTQADSVSAVDGVLFALAPSGSAPRFSNQDTTLREFDPKEGVEAIDAFASDASTNPYEDLSVSFPGSVNRVAFEINANSGNTIDVTTFNDGVVVDQIPLLTNPGGNFTFLGFETEIAFDSMLIAVGDAQGFGFWRLDNLRFESLDSGADAVIVSVDNEIQTLIGDPGTSDDARDKLEKASDKLADALEKFNEGEIKDSLKKVADAAKELSKAQEEGADVTALIDRLVDMALRVAQDEIDAAQGCDDGLEPAQQVDCQEKIEKANGEMSKAEDDRLQMEFEKAIDHYAKAWEHASKALP